MVVEQNLRQTVASEPSYEDSLPETEKELSKVEAKTSFKRQSLILRSLCFSILCVVFLSLPWFSHSFQLHGLQQKELAGSSWIAESSLQQKEPAKSITESLQQQELEAAYSAKQSFQLTEHSFQLTTAQFGVSFRAFSLPRRSFACSNSFPWISVTLSGRTQVQQKQLQQNLFRQELFRNQQNQQLWKQVLQQELLTQQVLQQKQQQQQFFSALCIPSRLRPSRTRASTASPTMMTTTTTTTTTTPRKPSFNQQWAQKSLAPQPGSFISNFQGELQQSASTPTTGTNQRVEEFVEMDNFPQQDPELAKHLAKLDNYSANFRNKFAEKNRQLRVWNRELAVSNSILTHKFRKRELEKLLADLRKSSTSLQSTTPRMSLIRTQATLENGFESLMSTSQTSMLVK